jgi:hypothetical protein
MNLPEIKTKALSLSGFHFETNILKELVLEAYYKDLQSKFEELFSKFRDIEYLISSFKEILEENWELIKYTGLSYTALPNNRVTQLMIGIAIYISNHEPDTHPMTLLIDNFLRSKQFDPSRFSSFSKYMSEKNCLEGKHLDLSSLNLINIYERFIKIFMAHSHMFDVKSNPYVKKDKLDEFKYGLKKVSAIYAFLFVEQSITVMCTSHLEVKLIELSLLNFICTFLDSNTVKNSDLVALFKSLSFNTGSILSSDDEKINVKLLSTQPK